MHHQSTGLARARTPLHPPDHPDDPGAPHNAWLHALRLAAAAEQYVAQLRAQMGLSSIEMSALLVLRETGPCTLTELATRVSMSRPAISGMAERLAVAGWIVRDGDERDRRRVVLRAAEHFDAELERRARAWRQRLQNHASASGEAWPEMVEHLDALAAIAERSALDLRS